MNLRWIGGLMCAIMLFGLASPAVLAAEEPLPVPEELAADAVIEAYAPEEPAYEPVAEELYVPEESEPELSEPEPVEEPEEPPQPEEEPVRSEELSEEPATQEPEELLPEEEPAEEPAEDVIDTASEEPVPEEEVDPLCNPEDPLYNKYMLGLDGAATYTYDDFTTRALNGETLRKGIDVSSWQNSINWSKVKADGVEFVFLRAAYQGTSSGKLFKDGRFQEYIRGAKSVGLKVGVYIFSQAITVDEALEQANFLMDLVSGYSIDLPLVFDLEHYPGGRFSTAGLYARDITDMCNTFCTRVESAGYQSMTYACPSMLDEDIFINEIGRLWLAHYTKETGYSDRGYEYWQCTDSGKIDGISGGVDLDFWFQPTGGLTSSVMPPPSNGPFSDVQPGDWYYESVMVAYNAGVVNGLSDSTFGPGGSATRGQVVTMLYRMAGSPSVSGKPSFTDLTQSYYQASVAWASANGYVNGYSDERFAPDRAITREELVAVLYRMKGSPSGGADLSGYTDAGAIQSFSRSAMAWAVENRILNGYSDLTLRPGAVASRAEVCAMLMRFGEL